eukprot:364930-Chlamydomonas_euryale.AAC.14
MGDAALRMGRGPEPTAAVSAFLPGSPARLSHAVLCLRIRRQGGGQAKRRRGSCKGIYRGPSGVHFLLVSRYRAGRHQSEGASLEHARDGNVQAMLSTARHVAMLLNAQLPVDFQPDCRQRR